MSKCSDSCLIFFTEKKMKVSVCTGALKLHVLLSAAQFRINICVPLLAVDFHSPGINPHTLKIPIIFNYSPKHSTAIPWVIYSAP